MRLAAAVCVCVVSHSALGQSPQPRELAAVSGVQVDLPVWETAIAVGAERAVSVFHVATATQPHAAQIGYGVATLDPNSGEWAWTEEGIIDPNGFTDLADPSVAYDAVTGDFLVCGFRRDPNVVFGFEGALVVARYDADTGSFDPWTQLTPFTYSLDKPWILAGEILTAQPTGGAGPMGPGYEPTQYQEFYITWFQAHALNYRRSTDGGHTWVGGSTSVGVGSWPTPRVFDDRPVFVTYLADIAETQIGLSRGVDINSGPGVGGVEFTQLLDADVGGNPPIAIELNRPRLEIAEHVPYNALRGDGLDLAVDPTDAERLYLAYHDTPSPTSSDVNVYLRVLTRVQGAKWSVGDAIPIVDSTVTEFESDRFMPTIKVDEDGGVHVTFYDDREYTDPDDPNDPNQDQQPDGFDPNNPVYPRFDVWYAFSPDQGGTWFEFELCDDPENDCQDTTPAVDYLDLDPNAPFVLGDYMGIDVRDGRVWTSFMGSSLLDENADKSVIWSTQILLPAP